MSKSRTINMTKGNPLKLMLAFALPLMFANLGQQLYLIVDAIIVGKFVGVSAFAAIGAAEWAYYLPLWAIGALTQGFAIPLAQAYGEKNITKLKESVATILVLCIICAIAFTLFFELAARTFLQMLGTPDEIVSASHNYLFIMYLGIPVLILYNMAGAVLRSLGDGKTPLLAIIVAACSNIVLDLIFILIFKWGLSGAAIASVLAQLIAGLYCFYHVLKVPDLKLNRSHFSLKLINIYEAFKLGSALFIQHALISIGGMILQSSINKEGLIFIAGFAATNKIYGLLESSAISIGHACTTYAAQNYGAKEYQRIRKGSIKILYVSIFISIGIALMSILVGTYVLKLFIESNNPNSDKILAVSYRYLFTMACSLPILYVLFVTRSTIQGIGKITIPLLSGLMEFLARPLIALLVYKYYGGDSLFYAEPTAWAAAVILLLPAFFLLMRSLRKSEFLPKQLR